MPETRLVRWPKRLLLWSSLGLGLTGMGQMPIFPRYAVADIPGLGWLGDFRVTAELHLLLASLFLLGLCSLVVPWLAARSQRGGLAWARAGLLGAVAATGFLRVLQNGALPLFGPLTVRYLDWSHLGLAAVLGVVFLIPLRRKSLAEVPAV
jgi:hypothetical protein